MKISYNWLKEYINTELSPETIAKLLTDGGLEVESIDKAETIKGGLKGLVIGEVLTCTKHPNADKLSVTTVDIGINETLQIVCGAPNVSAGQKVVVATVGTILYSEENSFEIKSSKIRGELSQGMICAEDEIGLGNSHDGIMVLNNDVEVGTPASTFFGIKTDYVFEIGITPNRSDATSHIGVARDLVALINLHHNSNLKLNIPKVESFKIDNTSNPVDIILKNPSDCPRYSGLTISNIKVQDSPQWMQDRLKSVGIRPINNIVDITNYVLLETGQPLHAFDLDTITTKKIVIQTLETNTEFISLDEANRKLQAEDLMICNDNIPMCMAGVFGGLNSGVAYNTTNIFIESAYFNPISIRKTSKHHGLKTDASFRFERGADPNITIYALKRAATLIKEIAGGEISSNIIDLYPKPIKPWNVELNLKTVEKITGKWIPTEIIESILRDLEIKIIEKNDQYYNLEIPTFKVDVTREIDVIEEILRIYGFNNIAISNSLKSSISYVKKPNNEMIVNIISDLLVSKGFYEAMNNSLTKDEYYTKYQFDSKENINILNPLSSELNVLRQHLVFGLLESARRNNNQKTKNIKLFELGKHYTAKNEVIDHVNKISERTQLGIIITGDENEESWNRTEKIVDFYSLKSIVYSIFERLGFNLKNFSIKEVKDESIYQQALFIQLNGKTLAEIGVLNSRLIKSFELNGEVYYSNIDWELLVRSTKNNKVSFSIISKYPAVRRDLAVLIDKTVKFAEIENLVLKADNKLIKAVNLFDVYEGKGIEESKKSYAFSVTLQDEEKTLTDNNIEKIMKKILYLLETNLGAKLR